MNNKLHIAVSPLTNVIYAGNTIKNRFSVPGDKYFQGEVGRYHLQVMEEKRQQIGVLEHVEASKRVGW